MWTGILAGVLLLAGCATRPYIPERVLGSAYHHVMNGAKLMQKGRVDAAQREFEAALKVDPFSPHAHRGASLISGIHGEFGAAFQAVHRAIRFTELAHMNSPEYSALNSVASSPWDGTRSGETSPGGLSAVDFLNIYYLMG
ncbi:MAG: hypothetical protein ACLFUP_07180, partial [Desulfobacteraceae bacterium]